MEGWENGRTEVGGCVVVVVVGVVDNQLLKGLKPAPCPSYIFGEASILSLAIQRR